MPRDPEREQRNREAFSDGAFAADVVLTAVSDEAVTGAIGATVKAAGEVAGGAVEVAGAVAGAAVEVAGDAVEIAGEAAGTVLGAIGDLLS